MKLLWIGIFSAVLIWSGIQPKDYPTWFLEVSPAIAGALILAFTHQKYPLTPLVNVLILIHCVILMVGGHYTYAEVPLFDWLKEPLGFERNNYDKLGHFAQGFVPAMIAREIILRNRLIDGRAWTHFFVVCFCLALNAFYELIEWGVALVSGEAAESFLGTQGYVWDTQSDMGFALLGAVAALLLLAGAHDRALEQQGHSAEPDRKQQYMTR